MAKVLSGSGPSASRLAAIHRRAMSRFPYHPARKSADASVAIQWLSTEPRAASVLDAARRLLAAQETLQRLVPGAMGQACRVALIEDARMVLSVPSAAHAAKLRQLAPTITRKMNEKGWNLTEITVKIQAARLQTAPQRPPKSVNPLGTAGVQAFSEIQPAIHPGPLADAIARLLKRHDPG
ncbi:DciA family protein [Paracandidimonas soli]